MEARADVLCVGTMLPASIMVSAPVRAAKASSRYWATLGVAFYEKWGRLVCHPSGLCGGFDWVLLPTSLLFRKRAGLARWAAILGAGNWDLHADTGVVERWREEG